MSLFLFILAGAWAIRIVGNVLAYVQLWWIKEYRFDRMLVHLGTTQGKRILWPHWKRPPVKPKTILLAALTLTALLTLFVFLPFNLIVNVFLADLFSFPITGILIFLFYIPTKLYHGVLLALAARKLRSHTPMTVIGITGSYGKTSVKDYLATILAEKFTVLKTEASKNSPIGIAEVVLKNLRPEHEIFVVEMGAYKRGEIAEMARMVKPQIGIITAINPQHQDLFGNLEHTMAAKYELITGLTGKKLGIFTADDERVRHMASWAKRDGISVWLWSKKIVKNIHSDFHGVKFTLVWQDEQATVNAPVLGEHQVGNVSLAILAALACGMNLSDAVRGAAKIKPAKGVMQKVAGMNGSTFIDDSFNNNPDAAKAAIRFLTKAKGRKILVFQPMIELGNYALLSHREVGKLAESVCDEIILTNDSFHKEFPSSKVMNARSAAKYLRTKLQKNDTVLFKGKEAGLVLKLCLEK